MAVIDLGRDIHITVSTIPNIRTEISGKTRTRMDFHGTWSAVQAFAAGAPNLVVLEDVGGGRPFQRGQLVQGHGAGALEMAIVAAGLPIHLETASVWKSALKLKPHKDRKERKGEARRAASRLFPAFSHLWALVKDDGKAEAVLLAWYGATKVLGYVSK